MNPDLIDRIIIPADVRRDLLKHCRRKLDGRYLAGEEPRPKAFGVVGGRIHGRVAAVTRVIELRRNVRNISPYREAMDRQLTRYAVPSETPLSGRGWVADPEELRGVVSLLRDEGLRIIGTYHMHRVAWEEDPHRDTPTLLDTILGRDSRLLMFIIAMVRPETPMIRAFVEGDVEREVRVDAEGEGIK